MIKGPCEMSPKFTMGFKFIFPLCVCVLWILLEIGDNVCWLFVLQSLSLRHRSDTEHLLKSNKKD